MSIRSLVAGLLTALVLVVPAFADEWIATKLRGSVFAFVDEEWVQLSRGDVVPDQRFIRTAPNGRVQFQRGLETIDLGPNTQIRIFDRDGQKFTIVQQQFGDVAIEAERRNVRHFAVQTKFLAAVVKGTKFTVRANAQGAEVDVSRGQVQVRDVARHVMTEVTPGQSANAGQAQALTVSGGGVKAPIVAFAGDALGAEVEALGAVNVANDGTVSPSTASSADAASTSFPGNSGNTPAAARKAAAAASSTVDAVTATVTAVTSPGNSGNTPAATKAASSTVNDTVNTVTETTTTVVDNVSSNAADVVANTPAASVVTGVGKALGHNK